MSFGFLIALAATLPLFEAAPQISHPPAPPTAPYESRAGATRYPASHHPDAPQLLPLGQVDFTPLASDFPKGDPGCPICVYATARVEIGFDKSGSAKSCEAVEPRVTQPFDQAVCAAIIKRARFIPNAQYQATKGIGYAGMEVTWNRQTKPARPVQFVGKNQGLPVQIEFLFSKGLHLFECASVSNASEGDVDRICSALQQTVAIKNGRYSNGTPIPDGPANMHVWVRPDPRFPDGIITVNQAEAWLYTPTPAYNVPEISAGEAMPQNGHLAVSITDEDYPDLAIRNDLEGSVKLQLGIDPSGKITSCQPYQSSGTAYLDDYSCALIQRKANYVFDPSVTRPDGVRYLRTALRWNLPD